MRMLVLGFSNIFQRRVFPVAAACGIRSIDIATASGRPVPEDSALVGDVYRDYGHAIQESGADIVYITTTNDLHVPLARLALRKGMHVIVDKPAVLNLPDAVELAEQATRSGLCLAEAAVFSVHPQIGRAREIFVEHGTRPTRISTMFSVPPFSADNFRYRRESGGGAIADTGVYAVAPGRLFFGDAPVTVQACVTARADDVETGYSLLMDFGGGRSLVGHFGFDTEYRNWIELVGPDLCVRFDRAFTTTPDLENAIHVIHKNEAKTEIAQSADSFLIYFETIVRDIRAGNFQHHAETMLEDAMSVDLLRRAAQS